MVVEVIVIVLLTKNVVMHVVVKNDAQKQDLIWNTTFLYLIFLLGSEFWDEFIDSKSSRIKSWIFEDDTDYFFWLNGLSPSRHMKRSNQKFAKSLARLKDTRPSIMTKRTGILDEPSHTICLPAGPNSAAFDWGSNKKGKEIFNSFLDFEKAFCHDQTRRNMRHGE